jgi:hypothetical protein
MLPEFMCSIRELLDIQRKGDNMTVREHAFLKETFNNFKYIRVDRITHADGKTMTPNDTQCNFVDKLLPTLIEIDEPKISEICALYGIKLDDVLSGTGSPYCL